MNVLLVDDNPLFLEGLCAMLRANGIVVLATATSTSEAITKARQLAPDVILMDVCMPGGGGIAALRAIKALLPETRIVMMTFAENDEHLFEAITAGASGYLLKGSSPECFVHALSGLAQGEVPLSAGLTAKIMAEFANRGRQRESLQQAETVLPLSKKQVEILRLVVEGRTYREIAAAQGLSEVTIKYHMGEIMDRLKVENRAQAIAYATRFILSQS